MYYDRLRTMLRRYAVGVHDEGEPASAAELDSAGKLPPGTRDLYCSWNGLRLFHDACVIEPLARLRKDGAELRLGEYDGSTLFLDERGRVRIEDETGDRIVAGSSLERFIDAVVAREKLLIGADGEFTDAFAESAELSMEMRRKRTRAAIKADPKSAFWQLELVELALDEKDAETAAEALQAAVEVDPGGLRRSPEIERLIKDVRVRSKLKLL
jgi:hypothetical protein